LKVVLQMGFCSEMVDTLVYPIFSLLYEIFHHLQSKGTTYRIFKRLSVYCTQKRFHCLKTPLHLILISSLANIVAVVCLHN